MIMVDVRRGVLLSATILPKGRHELLSSWQTCAPLPVPLPPTQTSLDNDLVSENLNPVSPIAKLKDSAFKRYDFTLGLPWTSQ